ncbi:MAG: ABC transporter ATP-binding protein [Bacteroidetes bacterium]|jgi:ATP-binding cassette, subfamily B, bacterial|nr:ABC transporter ATP-binding protein [Bacteroidota bacterium]
MKKTLTYCWKILELSWFANRYYSLLSIFGKIYESTIYPFIFVLILARVLDMLTEGKVVSFGSISWLIIIYLLASALRMVITSFLDTQQILQEIKMDNYLELQINKKLTELDPATFETPEFQNLLSQLEGVKGTINTNIMRITAFIDSIFKLVSASVIVATTFPIFIPIMFIATAPSFIIYDKYRQKVWKYFVEERSLLIRVSQYVKNLLSQDGTSKEVAIYRTGDILYSKVKNHQDTYTQKFLSASQAGMWGIIMARLVQFSAFIYTQALNLSAVIGGTLGVGQFTLFFQQTQNLMLGAEGILDNYSSINMRNKYLEKYFEFMNLEKKIQPPTSTNSIPKSPFPPLIEFKNVSFRYPNTKRHILKNFDLVIKPGEKVALVGENGAGKTTIIKLLLRFYDTTKGQVLINGVNIKDLELKEWYRYVGALFQDYIKYQFTFKENIYFGNKKETNNLELLKSAIKQSGADAFVKDLPDSYKQVVGKMFESGVDLSGGQWQKLALGRAFFKNAPILILDEPTSAIDAKAEYEIFERVQELQKDKTVIIISHRFSTVRNADRILVLNNGKIIEEGNHAKLMKLQGLYAELFEIQAKGYK